MPELSVHLGWTPPDTGVEQLMSALAPGIGISVGEDVPASPAYDVLVAGRPNREHLEASRRLRTVVIPWAGLSTGVRELLQDFPRLAVHNLHHNAAPTAESALALLLAAAKRVVPADRRMRAGDWADRGREHPALLLEGRNALVIGYGAIGRRVARLCGSLGMAVAAIRRDGGQAGTDEGIVVHGVDALASLLPRTDALLVCAPLTPQTRGMIGRDELALLPRGAVLVNVGRGPVVDEDALYEALASGHLHGAGLDVWYRYPQKGEDVTFPSERPFHELDNVVMSPHRGGSCDRTESLRMTHLAAVLNALARGESPPDRVDVERGY